MGEPDGLLEIRGRIREKLPESVLDSAPGVPDQLSRNNEIRQILLNKDPWDGIDYHNYRKLVRNLDIDMSSVPFTREWMQSGPESKIIWQHAAEIVGKVGLLIGDVPGLDQADIEARQALEGEVDKHISDLESELAGSREDDLGEKKSFSPDGSMIYAADNPGAYVRYVARTLLKNLSPVSLSEAPNYDQVRAEQGEFNELANLEGDSPNGMPKMGYVQGQNISEETREWHKVAGVLHLASMYLDTDQTTRGEN